ncbi:MAG: OmpA family protein [Candidatus Hydrogenedentes bacterium]|nr:OmpA family protein [Candidatus Hydrogenedentota bacterium]
MQLKYSWAVTLIALGAALTGCTTMGNKTVVPASVTVPGPGEYVSLHEVMVVVDASGSMYPGTSFAYAKALTQSMVKAFPDGTYKAGLLSYGGEWTFQWIDHPMVPLNRPTLERSADDLRFLTGSTPLNEAIDYVGKKYFSTSANRALIIISDGKTPSHPLLDTAVQMAYGGNLCIHTIQVNDDAAGGKLLADLATVTPCGTFRHGDSIATDTGMDAFIREVFFQDLAVLETVSADGSRNVLGIVYFDTDKSVVKSEYLDMLKNVAGTIKATPGMIVRVQGHTDYTASNGYNMALSKRRAEAVAAALRAQGVGDGSLELKYYGEESPAADNGTREGRQKNRRVELSVAK